MIVIRGAVLCGAPRYCEFRPDKPPMEMEPNGFLSETVKNHKLRIVWFEFDYAEE